MRIVTLSCPCYFQLLFFFPPDCTPEFSRCAFDMLLVVERECGYYTIDYGVCVVTM